MTTVLKTPPFRPLLTATSTVSLKSHKPFCLPFITTATTHHKRFSSNATKLSSCTSSVQLATRPSLLRFVKFVPFASQGEAETTETEQTVQEPEKLDFDQDGVSGYGEADYASGEEAADVEKTPSFILTSLQMYKEAIANNDEPRISEIEAFLKSIEDEKINLESKVATLTEELSIEKDRILRISADFDNFRKRTERERLSLVTNAQGEVVENLLPVLDNFERAKAQIKVEAEGEEKINNSYQSIYKQFVEILASLGVVPVETVGKPFDPLAMRQVGSKFSRVFDELFQKFGQVCSAIMREDSTDFEEGIILDEFRKGFKLGDRLLRPAMVKVSAGPGPAKPEQEGSSESESAANETSDEGSADTGSSA